MALEESLKEYRRYFRDNRQYSAVYELLVIAVRSKLAQPNVVYPLEK